MRLRHLHVQGFTQLDDVEIAFRDDAPNLIIGPNEAGKSHLMQALYGILFGLENPARYIPWSGEPTMRGTLDFTDASGKLVRLERNFVTNQVTVTEGTDEPWTVKAGPKDRVAAAQRYFQCLERWLGFRDTDIFTATTFVQQSEVVQASMGKIAPEVKRLITGAGEADYQHVLKDLDARLDRLRKKTPRMKDRDLEEKQVELVDLKTTYERASRQHDEVAKLKQQQERLEAKIQDTSILLEQQQHQLEQIGNLVKKEQAVAEVKRRFEELQEARQRFEEQREALQVAEKKRNAAVAAAAMDKVALRQLENDVKQAYTVIDTLEQRGDIANADAQAIERLDVPVQKARQRLDAFRAHAGVETVDEVFLQRLVANVRSAEERLSDLRKRGITDDLDPESLSRLNRAVEGAQARLDTIVQSAQVAEKSGNLVLAGLAALLAVVAVVLAVAMSPIALALLIPAAGLLAYGLRGNSPYETTTAESIEQARDAVKQAERERDDALARFGAATVDEAVKLWERYLAAVAEENRTRGELNGVLSQMRVHTVDEALRLVREYHAASSALTTAQQERNDALGKLGAVSIDDALKLRDEYEAAHDRLIKAEKARDEALQQLGVKTIEDAVLLRERYDRAESEMGKVEAALSALGDETTLDRDWREVRTKLAVAEEQVDLVLGENVALKLQSSEVRAAEATRLQESIADLSSELDSLQDRKKVVDRDLYIKGGDEQDVAVLALQIEAVQADIARIELQIQALKEAIGVLEGAVQEFYDNCLEPVTESASNLLKTITDGRYMEVHLSDGSLEPSVDSAVRQGIAAPDLSRGVCDQLYFSLRVALGEALAGGKVLPLILDDPFVNFDPDRLERTLEALEHLVQRTQVILFTCDPRYAEWMEPVLTLRRVDPVPPLLEATGAA